MVKLGVRWGDDSDIRIWFAWQWERYLKVSHCYSRIHKKVWGRCWEKSLLPLFPIHWPASTTVVGISYFSFPSSPDTKASLGKECLGPKVKKTVPSLSHRTAFSPRNPQHLSQHSASVAISVSLRRAGPLILSCFSRILRLPLPTVW